jgi:hypothetical protein
MRVTEDDANPTKRSMDSGGVNAIPLSDVRQ